MTIPPELLEQSLDAYGDTLYRIALIIVGDERRTAALLCAPAVAPVATNAPPDAFALLARLVAAARRQEERALAQGGARAPKKSGVNLFAPFAMQRLPLDQRLALGLYLLLGYDGAQLAGLLGGDEAAARAALIAGARALGPAVGTTLTDTFSGEQCAGVRDALVDPTATARQSAAVRGHLATCASCRAFDQAWGSLLAAIETTLRTALRERTLPPALRAKLLAQAGQRHRRGSGAWRITRVAMAPLGVLALIAALVLPGFLPAPVNVVERGQSPPVSAQALIAKAITRQMTPPDQPGVWYARYETAWFFNDDLYAPLRAEFWLDPRNPARHRLQLVHVDGGAPYELQIGDGAGEFAYALDAAYAPALYGALPTAARVEQPALVNQPLDPAGQVLARAERMATGPWAIPLAYLRQAQRAPDLRLLGRQRMGERVVQILSFTGVSPLGLPADAPGTAANRVTVLLALDSEDGLLRSATELLGATGTNQTSRVTWRLIDEQWLTGDEPIREAFAVERAWTGLGDFGQARTTPAADPAVPLVPREALGDLGRLRASNARPLWLPSRPPAGVERALLLWGGQSRGAAPDGLIYLGHGRRLILAFNRSQMVGGEHLEIGAWHVALRPGLGQRYTAFLDRSQTAATGPFDVSAKVLLDAYGFTRAELLAVIETMQPLDRASLRAQERLFIEPAGDGDAVRAEATSPPGD